MKKFYNEICKLKLIERRGWELQNFKTERTESDAEHVYSMLMLAMFLLKNDNKNLDILKVFKIILVHDLGKIEIGDITPFDNYDVKTKHLEEQKAIRKISNKFSFPEILELWEEYNVRLTKEAKFVKMIDLYVKQMLLKIIMKLYLKSYLMNTL